MRHALLFKIGQRPLSLIKGLAAYGLAELSVRLVRLVTVVIIARQLAPEIVGIAALSLTLFELIRVLANIGIGQRIIAAEPALLDATCNAAHRLFWLWCSGVALVQLAGAFILWSLFGQTLPAQMLAVLSLVYVLMPGGLVQCFLLMREGRAATTARTTAIQTISDHLLTAALLLIWQSPWSIVLPKLLTAPLWLIMTRRARSWKPDPAAGSVPARDMLGYGLPVLATELLLAMRNQLDKLIIAATLGVSALGSWYFAFNAGIGIVSSLITAFGTVTFPTLCAVSGSRDRVAALRLVAGLGTLVFLPLVIAQSALAPYYVPIIFGAHWDHATPLIATLCLAGIPMVFATVTTNWLRATNRPGLDARAGAVACAASLAGLWFGAQTGSMTLAAALWVLGLSLAILPFAVSILLPVLRSSPKTSNLEAIA